MRYVGIDFGKKRIGLAMSDEEGLLAFPKATLSNGPAVSAEIADIARRSGVDTIIIGESRDFGGRANTILEDSNLLARKLENLGFEVVFEEEYSSSVEAVKFQGNTEHIDASAAAIILQRFLDKKRFNK